MPLESATYIADLDVSNPAATDFLATTDDHLRLIKSVLKATFPNLDGPVLATDEQLSTAVTTAGGGIAALQITPQNNAQEGGELVLQGAGTNKAVVLDNLSGRFRIFHPSGAAALTVDPALGTVDAAQKLTEGGNPLIPRGFIGMWSGALGTIPAGWALCDGSIQGGLQTPDLRDRFVMGAGNGAVVGQKGGLNEHTVTTTSDGNHAHSGVTSISGSHSHGGVTAPTVLRVDQLPPHDHTLYSDDLLGAGGGSSTNPDYRPASRNIIIGNTGITGNGNPHDHGIFHDGDHGHEIGTYTAGAHTHKAIFDNRPLYFALAFIIKL